MYPTRYQEHSREDGISTLLDTPGDMTKKVRCFRDADPRQTQEQEEENKNEEYEKNIHPIQYIPIHLIQVNTFYRLTFNQF